MVSLCTQLESDMEETWSKSATKQSNENSLHKLIAYHHQEAMICFKSFKNQNDSKFKLIWIWKKSELQKFKFFLQLLTTILKVLALLIEDEITKIFSRVMHSMFSRNAWRCYHLKSRSQCSGGKLPQIARCKRLTSGDFWKRPKGTSSLEGNFQCSGVNCTHLRGSPEHG